MFRKKRIMAFIPARSGSKRLPGKNIMSFLGRPLIAWTIRQAKESRYIDDIIVSTDDEGIACIARSYGASVPFLRPRRLAKDETSTEEVVLHFLKAWSVGVKRMPDFVVLLQPTSPLRSALDIDRALHTLMLHKEAEAIVGIVEVAKGARSLKKITQDGFIGTLDIKHKGYRRPVFKTNGAVYVINCHTLLKEKTFFPRRTLGFLMPRERSVDIDSKDDFMLAESLSSAKCA